MSGAHNDHASAGVRNSPSGAEKRPFRTSLPAQEAARIVVETARRDGLLEGALTVDPALAEMEKALFAAMFRAVAARGSAELTPEEFTSMFYFVFARAAEAVTACWSGRPFETGTDGLFDGKAPFYADDALRGYFKKLSFPGDCAQNCWDWFSAERAPGEPLLSLFEALKWCFRCSCHAGFVFLERRHA